MNKIGNWFKSLSKGGQVTVVAVATILGLGTVGSMAQPSSTQVDEPIKANAVQTAPSPTVTTETATETESVPFEKTSVESSSYDSGSSTVTTAGVDGVRTRTYEITLTDGKETSRKLIKEEVTTQPVNEVTTIGTYVKPKPAPVQQKSSCDPNYSGACVPIASDVDCAGGSGNGPAYVSGPVYVIGVDIYDLDRDGDGVGCQG